MTKPAIDDDVRLRRPGRMRTVRMGDTRVSFVPDGAVRLPPRGWLPDSTAEAWAAHPEYLDPSDHLVASIGGLLVERGDHALLIDAGFGPQTLPPDPGTPRGPIHGGALLDNLVKLGRRPAEIETVAFTHLHPDHIGWAWHRAPGSTQGAFARARYVVAEPEWNQPGIPDAYGLTEEIVSALAPRVRTVTDGHELLPGVRLRITAGHTAGHAEYVVTAGGRRLIAFGDALHSPIQIAHPEWSAAVDHDAARSADHRRRLVAELEEPDTIGFGIHFADVMFGRVVRTGAGPTWRSVDA